MNAISGVVALAFYALWHMLVFLVVGATLLYAELQLPLVQTSLYMLVPPSVVLLGWLLRIYAELAGRGGYMYPTYRWVNYPVWVGVATVGSYLVHGLWGWTTHPPLLAMVPILLLVSVPCARWAKAIDLNLGRWGNWLGYFGQRHPVEYRMGIESIVYRPFE